MREELSLGCLLVNGYHVNDLPPNRSHCIKRQILPHASHPIINGSSSPNDYLFRIQPAYILLLHPVVPKLLLLPALISMSQLQHPYYPSRSSPVLADKAFRYALIHRLDNIWLQGRILFHQDQCFKCLGLTRPELHHETFVAFPGLSSK